MENEEPAPTADERRRTTMEWGQKDAGPDRGDRGADREEKTEGLERMAARVKMMETVKTEGVDVDVDVDVGCADGGGRRREREEGEGRKRATSQAEKAFDRVTWTVSSGAGG